MIEFMSKAKDFYPLQKKHKNQNLGVKYGQKLLDNTKKSTTDL